MTQVPSVLLPYIEWAYRPNEVSKRDPDGATFVAKATGKAYPGLFANVGGMDAFFNGVFGHEAGREFQVNLGQRAGPCALSAFHTMKDLKFFD
jgi:hypothetical protein